MASLSHDKATGRRTIQVVGTDGKRHSIRLGEVDKKQAENARRFIEDLEKSRLSGSAPLKTTAEWVAAQTPVRHKRLEAAGLVEPREDQERPTVAAWVDAYIAGRTDVKPRTKINLKQTAKDMKDFFGRKRLHEVTAGDADDLRTYLKVERKLSEGTLRRQIKRARQFFAAAVKRRLLTENPFAGIKCGHYSDSRRFKFVSMEDAEAVLAACPDTDWRTIFALSRFGGLRCPSEVLALTWADVDWDRERFAVHSAKTEHTGGDGGTRHVPIFPELLPYLRAAFEAAEAGQVHVVSQRHLDSENLRTQMARIIKKAGVAVWPKLFQNCRATREIELCEKFPQHVVAKWMGHSESIANRHYLKVTEDHFRRAAKEPTGVVQKAVQSGAETERNAAQAPPEKPANAALCDDVDIKDTPKGIRTPCLRVETPVS
jgi:integrase